MRPRSLIMGLPILILSAKVHAGFINGVETFDGTTLDTNTWQVFSTLTNPPISQNASLTISGSGFIADYTTTTQTVSVGQKLTVNVQINSLLGAPDQVRLILASNSGGTSLPSTSDDFQIGITSSSSGLETYYQDTVRHYGVLSTSHQTTGVSYLYEIDRLTSSQSRWAIFDGANNLVFSQTVTMTGDQAHAVAPYPDPLYISLAANANVLDNISATFDNVTVSPISVPEPSGLLLLGLGASAVLTKRARQPKN